METATEQARTPAEEHRHAHGASPAAIDPEHDIDARKTVIWLGGALVFVVVTLIALSHWFTFIVQKQQHDKINEIPATELRALRSDEDHYLRGQAPVGEADTRSLVEIQESIRAATDGIISSYLDGK